MIKNKITNNKALKKQEKTKQTKVKTELSKLPWPIINLREICRPEYGYTTSVKNFGRYRLIRITDIDENGLLKLENKKYALVKEDIQKFILKKLDILVVRTSATYGKVLLFEDNEPAIFASYLIRLCFSKDRINHKFYWFFSQSKAYWNQVQLLVSGAGQPQFNANAIVKIKIPLPPLDEQKKIAVVLSQIQQNINTKSKLIETTKELKKSMMKRLFTYGIKSEKTKQTEIGKIPESWRVSKFKNSIQEISIKRSNQVRKNNYLKTGKYPIIDQGKDFISGWTNNKSLLFDKRLPVIIFGDHTRIFKYLEKPFVLGADWTKLICPIDNYDIKFFYYSLVNKKIPNKGYSRHYSLLKEMILPLPPLEEQKKIADILQKVDEMIRNYEEQKEALQDLFKSMLHKLMTAQIRLHSIDINISKGFTSN